jgi:hypothetical protein
VPWKLASFVLGPAPHHKLDVLTTPNLTDNFCLRDLDIFVQWKKLLEAYGLVQS